MKRELISCAICAGCLGTVGCDQDSQNDSMDALLQSLALDPSIELEIDCLPPPPEARSVSFAGTTGRGVVAAAQLGDSPPGQPAAPVWSCFLV